MQYHCHIFCGEDDDFEAEALNICAKIGRWPSNIAPFDGKSTEHMLKLNGIVWYIRYITDITVYLMMIL